jgi:hypothetical protein
MDRARDRLPPAGPCDGRASRAPAAGTAPLVSGVLIPGKHLRIRYIVPPPPGEDAGRQVKLAIVTHPKRRTAIVLCGAVATLAFAVGYGPGEDPPAASSSSVTVTPALPPAPGSPGGAFPAVPAGGGGCYIGLNCGCIPRITCPTPHRHPPAVAPGHDATGGQNP